MTMQSDTQTKRFPYIESVSEYAFIAHLVLMFILLDIGDDQGFLVAFGATVAVILLSAGAQLVALRHLKPKERYRAGPKPHWRQLRSLKEREKVEGIQSVVLSMIPLVLMLPILALASSALSLSTHIWNAL